MQRYPVMFQAMREALASDAWKKNVRFVGYAAFGRAGFGRWSGPKDYSLITDEWTSPDWYISDGGSPSYHTRNWNDNRDHWVWSTYVQSMNWIFQLAEASKNQSGIPVGDIHLGWKRLELDSRRRVHLGNAQGLARASCPCCPNHRQDADATIEALPIYAGRPDIYAEALLGLPSAPPSLPKGCPEGVPRQRPLVFARH